MVVKNAKGFPKNSTQTRPDKRIRKAIIPFLGLIYLFIFLMRDLSNPFTSLIIVDIPSQPQLSENFIRKQVNGAG